MTKNTNYVSHKKSKVKNNGKPQLPSPDVLVDGEIAINYAENVETLSIKNESGTIVTFSSDNYYTEQKLGSGFTNSNSANTVTDVTDAISGFANSTAVAVLALNENKTDLSAFTNHTASTVHMSSTEKNNLDSLEDNIASISGITSAKVTDWDNASTNSHTHINKDYLDTISGSVGSMAYESVNSYSSATEVNTAFGEKVNIIDVISAITSSNSGSTAPVSVKAVSSILNSLNDNKFGGVDYDSETKRINFYATDTTGTVLTYVDASPFIIDGMVDDVKIENIVGSGTCLVVSFNTDAGKQDINIPIGDIFDASNYYDKTHIDEKLGSGFTGENSANTITSVIENNELVTSAALNDLNTLIIEKHANDATVQDVNNLPIPPSGDCTTLEEYIDEALEGARLVNAELSGSVVSITNNSGQTTSIDLLNATEETVQIVVTTSVVGVDVSGLTINVYYNGASTPTTAVTTDENGMVALRVPNGYTYKLDFPSIEGCVEPAPVIHTAAVSQRSVEVEYKEYSSDNSEKVTVLIRDYDSNFYTKVSGVTVTISYGDTTNVYTTDSGGTVSFYIPYGQTYSATTQVREGKHIRYGNYTQTYKSQLETRVIYFTYYNYEVGVFIVTADGSQYSLTEWKSLVESGMKQNDEALYIKIATADLSKNNGTFVIDIDMVREQNYGNNLTWCDQNVEFYSIPLNGNSASANYYYDGLNASKLIFQEGVDRQLQTPAVTKCLEMTRIIREGAENEQVLQGFLGSTGQWGALWFNLADIDEILVYTRPEGSYTLSSQTMNKWTCTQYNANNACNWATNAGYGNKGNAYAVVPFFAF